MPSLPNPLTLITGTAAVVVAVVVAIWLWRKNRKAAKQEAAAAPQPAGGSGGGAAGQIQGWLREAQSRLKVSPTMKGVALTSLPAYLLVGPEKSGKTSLMLHSGMDAELLAGQVYQGTEVLPTKSLNIWLARGALWIEAPSSLAADAAAMTALMKRLAPPKLATAFGRQQPPRAILLCLNSVSPDEAPDAVSAAARPWNQSLIAAAAGLGAQLPVYVLFTASDKLAGFPEFVANLGGADCEQALGATIRPFNPNAGGAYAEETARTVNEQVQQIADSLCDCRVPVMNREQDKIRVANQYQFPREFKKLQKNLVQFLVDLAKPSQLQVSPFLRGFYFAGTRKVLAEGAQAVAQQIPVEPAGAESFGATRLLSPEQMRQQMAAAQVAATGPRQREIAEWMFVAPLFEAVLLGDSAAHGVSAASSRTDRIRAAVCAVLLVLGIFWFAALCISYARNRALERDLAEGARVLGRPGGNVYEKLEQMRAPVQRLLDNQEHTPLSMRWGLYAGESLLPPAQEIYCSNLREQVLGPVLGRMTDRLGQAADFQLLKAFMMMTTHPGKADTAFLAGPLMEYWRAAQPAPNPAADKLVEGEFRTYGRLLPIQAAQTACVFRPPDGLIRSTQDKLRALNANDRYQSFLQQAGRGIEPVNYNKRFPNDAVSDSKEVPGWFTKQGWNRMQELLADPAKSLRADAWVLGQSTEPSPEDLAAMAADYRKRYIADYQQAWKDYLGGASVTKYANLEDAAKKLEKMSGQSSFLLSLIALATEHTAGIEPFKVPFGPAKAAAPALDNFQPASKYLNQLDRLKNRLGQAAGNGGAVADPVAQEVRTAALGAFDAVDEIAASPGFKGETDQIVKAILKKPITQIEGLLKGQDAEALNGAGKGLCASIGSVSHKLPFALSESNAPPEDVQRIFAPETGEIFQFLKGNLADSLDCIDGVCRLKANPKHPLSQPFVNYFNNLLAWSHLLNSGRSGAVRLQVSAQAYNDLRSAELWIDRQRTPLPAEGAPVFVEWDPLRSQAFVLNGLFTGSDQLQDIARTSGPWAIFAWLQSAEGPGFTWKPTYGAKQPRRLPGSMHTTDYRMSISFAGRPLNLRSMSLGVCQLPIAK